MGKCVYLFELDSVRNDEKNIKFGMKTMFNEIIKNGNTVVLTYNQFVDNIGFLSLLQEEEARNNLITLFKNNALKISQHGELRNISYYLLNSLERAYAPSDEDNFKFSALPIKSSQKKLIALITRAVKHSDLTEIIDYINIKEDDKEGQKRLNDLFVERYDGIAYEPNKNVDKLEILTFLKNYLTLIFDLSTCEWIYQHPKCRNNDSSLNINTYINFIINHAESSENLKTLLKKINKSNDRSKLLDDIDKYKASEKTKTKAKYIVDLAYNYTCEVSILNTSKHYNLHIDETSGNLEIDKKSFCQDYKQRLKQIEYDYRKEDTATLDCLLDNKILKHLRRAARISAYNTNEAQDYLDITPTYEFELKKQVRKQKIKLSKKLLFKLLSLLGILAVVFVWSIIQSIYQSLLTGNFEIFTNFNNILEMTVETILFLILGEVLTTLLSKVFSFILPLSEIAFDIFNVLKDFIIIVVNKRNSYINNSMVGKESTEPKGDESVIKYITPKEILKYKKIIEDNENRSKGPSKTNDFYPIANILDKKDGASITEQVIHNSEIYGRTYGVTHESEYTKMVVDPIINTKTRSKDKYYPYERSIPKKGKEGMVAIVKYKDKFLLLDQERHAIRGTQKCFIRGYGENINQKDNAKKEISEELDIKLEDISKPIHLGTITPDSGASANKTEIYYAEVTKYHINKGYEGIINCMTVSKKKLEDMIANNDIQDSFTICAYTLYKTKKLDRSKI